ncbi:MAG: hypothetical protein GY750_09455 [Lentisphaerae bacterium]|nr:hypothetical protein [Lentisphaerota bacterium]MCP4101638.1 hypothetical protein [Lentisphaerota bacterium]
MIGEILRTFLGWCLLLNIAILLLTAIIIIPLKHPISRLHAKIFGLEEKVVLRSYFQYMACYKIAIIVLNLVPYITLLIMV